MSTARIICGVFFLIAGTVYALIDWHAGHVVGGIAWLGAGVLAAWLVALGFLAARDSISWQLGTGICSALAIIATVQGSNLTDLCQQAALPAVFVRFFELASDASQNGLDPDGQKLALRGYFACGMQSEIDAAKLTMDLMKATYLGPGSSISVQVLSDITASPPNMSCMDYYRALHKLKPDAFLIVESEHPCIVPHDQDASS